MSSSALFHGSTSACVCGAEGLCDCVCMREHFIMLNVLRWCMFCLPPHRNQSFSLTETLQPTQTRVCVYVCVAVASQAPTIRL